MHGQGLSPGNIPPDYERAFVGFDISSIHSTIVSATLRIYQAEITEGAPYTALGNLIVDHVNFGTSLSSADFTGNTLTNNIGTISNNANIEWKTLDVKDYVQADINAGRTSSQFRIRFTNDTAVDENWITLEDADDYCDTGNKPELVVTYY